MNNFSFDKNINQLNVEEIAPEDLEVISGGSSLFMPTRFPGMIQTPGIPRIPTRPWPPYIMTNQ